MSNRTEKLADGELFSRNESFSRYAGYRLKHGTTGIGTEVASRNIAVRPESKTPRSGDRGVLVFGFRAARLSRAARHHCEFADLVQHRRQLHGVQLADVRNHLGDELVAHQLTDFVFERAPGRGQQIADANM